MLFLLLRRFHIRPELFVYALINFFYDFRVIHASTGNEFREPYSLIEIGRKVRLFIAICFALFTFLLLVLGYNWDFNAGWGGASAISLILNKKNGKNTFIAADRPTVQFLPHTI
jgi:hypothetical protein